MADNPTCPACGHYNAILGRTCRDCGIDVVHHECAKLPDQFGLRGFPGETFRASRTSSYVNDHGKVTIYLSVRRCPCGDADRNAHQPGCPGSKWVDHSKGSLVEIQREMVQLVKHIPTCTCATCKPTNALQLALQEVCSIQRESTLTTAYRALIAVRNALNSEAFNVVNLDQRTFALLDAAVSETFEAQASLENIPGVVP